MINTGLYGKQHVSNNCQIFLVKSVLYVKVSKVENLLEKSYYT
jgi:hypothetical protein